jgi:acyl dehydratase
MSEDVRYIEEFAVGHTFESAEIELTAEAIVAFARQFDPQAMHTDAAAARGGFFGRLVASGWHTAALTMKLMVEARPFGAGAFIGVRVEDMRFHRPVEPGARVRAVGEILEIGESRGSFARAAMAVTTFADGEPVLSQRWTILAPSRGA